MMYQVKQYLSNQSVNQYVHVIYLRNITIFLSQLNVCKFSIVDACRFLLLVKLLKCKTSNLSLPQLYLRFELQILCFFREAKV